MIKYSIQKRRNSKNFLLLIFEYCLHFLYSFGMWAYGPGYIAENEIDINAEMAA